jgi:hypothetical protein
MLRAAGGGVGAGAAALLPASGFEASVGDCVGEELVFIVGWFMLVTVMMVVEGRDLVDDVLVGGIS